jgi:hypothetical protein
MTKMTDLDKFLRDLSKLTLKHGYVIGGCGCCGSPFVSKETIKPGRYDCDGETDLRWVKD